MKYLIPLLFLAASAQAQTIGPCYTLMDVTDVTASANGTGVAISALGDGFIAYEVATEDSGTASLDISLEHATSCSGTFVALKDKGNTAVTFTQLTGTDAMATVKGQVTMFPCVRAVRTITGSGQWDVAVKLCVTNY